MTTIQVILQLHYLSGEIRLVYIFTRIISFKSADHILCTLRNEAALVHRKELQFLPQRPPSTDTPEPEVTKNLKVTSEMLEPVAILPTQENEKGWAKARMETRVCRWSVSLSDSYSAYGHETRLSVPPKDAAGHSPTHSA